MFDVGFWELLIIAVIGLLVIGPERLPGVARTVGAWVGKARRVFQSVKEEVDREINAEELQRSMREHLDIPDLDRKLLDEDATRPPRRKRGKDAPRAGDDHEDPQGDTPDDREQDAGVNDDRDAETHDSADDRPR